jgi:DNA-binding CsgD family transcriptional regulator
MRGEGVRRRTAARHTAGTAHSPTRLRFRLIRTHPHALHGIRSDGSPYPGNLLVPPHLGLTMAAIRRSTWNRPSNVHNSPVLDDRRARGAYRGRETLAEDRARVKNTVLRGRAHELSTANNTLRRTLRTGQSGILLLVGQPGDGKSALLNAIGALAADAGFALASSKADLVNQVYPGAALLLALRSGPVPLVEGEEFARLSLLVQQPLLLAEAIGGLLEKTTLERPVLVAIDDAHRADPLSLFSLRLLTSRLAGTPVVWVLSSRSPEQPLLEKLTVPGGQGPWPTVIPVGPLSTADVTAMAQDRLGRMPSSSVRAMLEGVGGNPLLVVQICEGLARDRAIGKDGDQRPEDFVRGLRRALGRLQPQEVELVRTAAVLGRPFALSEAVELMSAESSSVALVWIDHGVDVGLFLDQGSVIGFRHVLVRETIYDDLTERLKQSLHRRCADFLRSAGHRAQDVVPHLRAATDPDDDEPVPILRRAAEEAVLARPGLAGDLILDAFNRLAVTHPQWPEVGRQCVTILARVQRGGDAVLVAERLLSRVEDPDELARIQVLLTHTLWTMGRPAQTEDASGRVGVSEAHRARLEAVRALIATRQQPARVIRPTAEAALRRARRLGDEPAVRLALHACGEAARNHGHQAQALALFREMRTGSDATYLAEEITGLQLLDRYDDADRMLRALWEDDRNGIEAVLPSLRQAQMWQDFQCARLDEAESGARFLAQLSQELGHDRYRLEALMVLTVIALLRGDPPQARARLELMTKDVTTRTGLATALVLIQGWLSAAGGRWDEAITTLSPALPAIHESPTSWAWCPGWTRMLVLVGLAAGDAEFVATAVSLAEEDAARNPANAGSEGVAFQLRALVNGDLQLMERSARILAANARPLLRAGSAEDYGHLLIAQGRRGEGLAHLNQAWDLLHGIGALGAVKLSQELMDARGIDRMKWQTDGGRPALGWDALTPAEMKVSQLVAAGHTNRSAARELGLSPNTVGTHLRSIFTKLDVQSRVQLTNLVHNQAHPFT